MPETCEEILERLRNMANPANVAGMARYGINPENTLGVPIPVLRSMAKEIGKEHNLVKSCGRLAFTRGASWRLL